MNQELELIKKRLMSVEDDIRNFKAGRWALETAHGAEILREVGELKEAVEKISKDDTEIRDHVKLVQSDFYNEKDGLKYKLTDLLEKFSGFVEGLIQMKKSNSNYNKATMILLALIFGHSVYVNDINKSVSGIVYKTDTVKTILFPYQVGLDSTQTELYLKNKFQIPK